MPPEVRERQKAARDCSGADLWHRPTTTWLEPKLQLKIRHLRGDEGSFLRHAAVKGLTDG
jgi:hypothetical protein